MITTLSLRKPISVTYTDAAGNVEVIRTTGTHEFFVEGVGWKAAQHLSAGQQLILPDGETATVSSVETEAIPNGIVVYNFSVTDGATYFVDDGQGDVSAVWVHDATSIANSFLHLFGQQRYKK